MVEDLHLILGPNLGFMSHDSSFSEDSNADESYDEDNCYNIHTHHIARSSPGICGSFLCHRHSAR